MTARTVTADEARAMVAAATPGPWTHERVGYGQYAVIPDCRCEIFIDREHDATLIAAAPDLAATVVALHDRVVVVEGGRVAARSERAFFSSECERLRSERDALAAQIDTLRSLVGQDRAAVIEELADARRERDNWNARATALEGELDEARAEVARLRALHAEAMTAHDRIATAMVCRADGLDDLVEAVRLLVSERDEARAEVARLQAVRAPGIDPRSKTARYPADDE